MAPSREAVRLAPAPVAWTALRYEMPTGHGPTRAFLWRALRRRQGLNLRRGLWALPHRPDAPPDLDAVLDRLRASGATVSAEAVDPEDGEHHELLTSACEKLWKDFAGEADQLARVAGGAGSSAHLARGLPALHHTFCETRIRDVVGSLAGEGAAQRLDDLEWMEARLRPSSAAHPRPARPVVPEVRPASAVLLTDGAVRAVALLTPPPDLGWEHRFADFERAVYTDTGDRTAVRHGTVVVTGEADEVSRRLDAVVARLSRFAASGG